MTKRKIARPKTRTKRRSLPRVTAAREPKTSQTHSPEPPAAPSPEPTFTLADFYAAFGGNYAGSDRHDPITVALDAIDDLTRVIELANECVHRDGDYNALSGVLGAAWNRGNAAIEVLSRFVPASLAAGQVTP